MKPGLPGIILTDDAPGAVDTSMRNCSLDTQKELLHILDEVLGLNGRVADFTVDSPLMGAVPELDSMAVIGLINLIEERFGFFVGEDEVDASTFASVGSLLAYVDEKLANPQA